MPISNQKEYDYIIAGAGCAGLSLLMRMLKQPALIGKKILLIDKEEKINNDRTWCFWEKEQGLFETLVVKEWKDLDFFSKSWSSALEITPYRYKMIRGVDFYKYCLDEISRHANVEIRRGMVSGLDIACKEQAIFIDGVRVNTTGSTIFSSIYHPNSNIKTIKLIQHFKGWLIETDQDCFDATKATLMDFRISQQYGTSFVYVLPLSARRALVEYTLFTATLLQPGDYDVGLSSYISEYLKIPDYKIQEQEFGMIPMTNEQFQFNNKGVYQIGTAGGQTKASSGYTFQFIQKNSAAIVDCLASGNSLDKIKPTPWRFRFYDNILLNILYHNKLPGDEIFSTLFEKNKADRVLKFLDNESSVIDELKIISSLPVVPFLKAAIRQVGVV